jgi:hypothetical protein
MEKSKENAKAKRKFRGFGFQSLKIPLQILKCSFRPHIMCGRVDI